MSNLNKINQVKLTAIMAVILSTTTLSYAEEHKGFNDDNRIIQLSAQELQEFQKKLKKANVKVQPRILSEAELIKNPGYLEYNLVEAAKAENLDNIKLFLPVYKKVSDADPYIIKWSEALLASEKQQFNTAVNNLREIIAVNPDIFWVRYQLAKALYFNLQDDAALDQFQKLRSMVKGNDEEIINSFITGIQNRNSWSTYGGIDLLNDRNLNNAPKKGTTITVGDYTATSDAIPEAGYGFGYNFGLDKKWSKNNEFIAIHPSIDGSVYLNNHKYDKYNFEFAAGVGYQSAQATFELIPHYSREFLGKDKTITNRRYSDSKGVRVSFNRWLGNKWKYAFFGDIYANKNNANRKYLDTKELSLSNTLTYFTENNSLYGFGIDYNRSRNDLYLADSYKRFGGRVFVVKELGNGISTRLSLSYAVRHYDGADLTTQLIKRSNKEYSAGITLWHRAISFYGVTPQITYQYTKINSNNAFSKYDKHKVFLSLSKTF